MKANREVTGHKTVMVEKVIPVEEIVLRMSMKEASVLLAVCHRIGGDPTGPRGVFTDHRDSLGVRLQSLGVTPADVHKDGSVRIDSASWTNE